MFALKRLLIPPQPILGRWNSVVKKENVVKFMDQGNFDNCYQKMEIDFLSKKSIEILKNYFKDKK